jgi:hypothetical protein
MSRMSELRERIRSLEADLVQELHLSRESRGYHLEGRRVQIEDAIRRAHRHRRKRVRSFLRDARMSSFITAPVIYLAVIPALLLDLYVTLYQIVCFPAYGIPKVKRGDYLILDRHHLPYLNGIEKLNCYYCGYFNGLMAYIQEIAARTEQHWCPIKHARIPKTLHNRYRHFFDYGDAEGYRARLEQVRRDFTDLDEGSSFR